MHWSDHSFTMSQGSPSKWGGNGLSGVKTFLFQFTHDSMEWKWKGRSLHFRKLCQYFNTSWLMWSTRVSCSTYHSQPHLTSPPVCLPYPPINSKISPIQMVPTQQCPKGQIWKTPTLTLTITCGHQKGRWAMIKTKWGFLRKLWQKETLTFEFHSTKKVLPRENEVLTDILKLAIRKGWRMILSAWALRALDTTGASADAVWVCWADDLTAAWQARCSLYGSITARVLQLHHSVLSSVL